MTMIRLTIALGFVALTAVKRPGFPGGSNL